MFARVIPYMGVNSCNGNLTGKILRCMLATLGLRHAEPSLSMSCVCVRVRLLPLSPLSMESGSGFAVCSCCPPKRLTYLSTPIHVSTCLPTCPSTHLPVYLPTDQAADILLLCTQNTYAIARGGAVHDAESGHSGHCPDAQGIDRLASTDKHPGPVYMLRMLIPLRHGQCYIVGSEACATSWP